MNGFVDKKTLADLKNAAGRFRAHLIPTRTRLGPVTVGMKAHARLQHWSTLSSGPSMEEALDRILEIALTIADRAVPADGADVAPFRAEPEQMVSAHDGFREVK